MIHKVLCLRGSVGMADDALPELLTIDDDTRVGDIIVTIVADLLPSVAADVAWSIDVVNHPEITRSASRAPMGAVRESGTARRVALILVPHGGVPRIVQLNSSLEAHVNVAAAVQPSVDGIYVFRVNYHEHGQPLELSAFKTWLDS